MFSSKAISPMSWVLKILLQSHLGFAFAELCRLGTGFYIHFLPWNVYTVQAVNFSFHIYTRVHLNFSWGAPTNPQAEPEAESHLLVGSFVRSGSFPSKTLSGSCFWPRSGWKPTTPLQTLKSWQAFYTPSAFALVSDNFPFFQAQLCIFFCCCLFISYLGFGGFFHFILIS